MIDTEVFLAFSTYATIVILKMMLMGLFTSYLRLTKKVSYKSRTLQMFYSTHLNQCNVSQKVFANLEDTNLVKTTEDRRKCVRVDPDVERVRR